MARRVSRNSACGWSCGIVPAQQSPCAAVQYQRSRPRAWTGDHARPLVRQSHPQRAPLTARAKTGPAPTRSRRGAGPDAIQISPREPFAGQNRAGLTLLAGWERSCAQERAPAHRGLTGCRRRGVHLNLVEHLFDKFSFDWYVWSCGGRLDPSVAGRMATPDPHPIRLKEPAMVRRYEESIEVRAGVGAVGLEAPREGCGGIDVQDPPPSAFVWRGRLYIVRDVIGHWRERRAWWREALDPDEEVAAHGLDSLEHEVWRVEASPGRLAGTGVYDLGMDGSARSWRLLRVAD